MNLSDLAKRAAFLRHDTAKTSNRPVIDALESRALMSSSPTVTNSDTPVPAAAHFQLLALKATVTSIKVYTATSNVGQAVRIAAVVSGRTSAIPTGTITFKAGTTVLGTATLDRSGIAKITTTAIPIGSALIQAVYSGSSGFAGSTSIARGHIVIGTATTARLSISQTAPLFGSGITLAARVYPVTGTASATGRVAFYDGSTLIGSHTLNSAGVARVTTSYLYVGDHAIKAVYLGSPTLAGHRSTVQTVTVATPNISTRSDGLSVGTIIPGTGVGAATGDTLTVFYTLYLAGKKIESSLDTGQPLTFPLGSGDVIPGWDEGLVGATQGERRVLIVPPSLGYGSTTSHGIPGNSTLVFVLYVVGVTQMA